MQASRELPVVWAVAKGSFLNKLILVPSALAISFFAPVLINILLIIGGLYLCYEGAEKVIHKLFHSKEEKGNSKDRLAPLLDPSIDIQLLESTKIKGAIRTDFVLSAEIIVIILGTLQSVSFGTQVTVLSLLALAFTVGVYGFVALIVKIDDIGLYLLRKAESGYFNRLQRTLGRALLIFAPLLMKALSIIGTAAMFLVGGGIIVHGLPFLHHLAEQYTDFSSLLPNFASIANSISLVLINGFVGVVSGLLVLLIINAFNKLKS